MSWIVLALAVAVSGVALLVVAKRRLELARMSETVANRDTAIRSGAHAAQLQHPVVDLTRCLGCGTCVAACPEEGVLELVHGQALVVRGAHCVGTAACERECPTGAIAITLADVSERRDIPVLDERLEAVGTPGLFLAGEVTAHALIKTAVDHGVAVATAVAERIDEEAREAELDSNLFDLCIVGAGPAGLACALEAKRRGLSFVVIDQEERAGGTVAQYPRRKLVMTQPVEMPLYGRFKQTSYSKEELIDLWSNMVVEQELPIHCGQAFRGLERDARGDFSVQIESEEHGSERIAARNVCLALGRRGSPRKLGIPGEDLPKVAYSLLDAQSYQGRRVVVVGGGDSAVEAAMGLAEQEGNEVTLSYRGSEFKKIRPKNARRIEADVTAGKLTVVYESNLRAIHDGSVELAMHDGNIERLANDDVFVMAGGIPPFELLEQSGVSFDPSLRPEPVLVGERGSGGFRALAIGFALSLAALVFALFNADYYFLESWDRPAHPKHDLLRPGLGLGLGLGIAALVLIIVNLLYLLRRSPKVRFTFGSLQLWMTSHVATGVLAFLFAMLHAAMSPRDTVGGHAFWILGVLIVTGAIGRYFYAYIPRAANGRELALAEVKAQLGSMSAEWDQGQQQFRATARDEVEAMIERRQWRGNFFGRVLAIFGAQHDLRAATAKVRRRGRAEGIDDQEIDETVQLVRTAHRTAMMAAHYEDLRGLLSSWRYIHRWGAALMLALVVLHIVYALLYGAHFFERGGLM